MNNDLEQLSEKRLQGFIDRISVGNMRDSPTLQEMLSLYRIALAAMRAKPVGYIAEVSGNRVGVLRGLPLPEIGSLIYTPQQPAHTEQGGCHWYLDEDYGYSTGCGNEWQFTDGDLRDNQIKYCPYCGSLIKEYKEQRTNS